MQVARFTVQAQFLSGCGLEILLRTCVVSKTCNMGA